MSRPEGNFGKLTVIQRKQTRKVASMHALEKVLEAANPHVSPRLAVQRTLQHAFGRVPVVIHVDMEDTLSACTTLGDTQAQLGFPPRPDVQYVKRLHTGYSAVRERLGESGVRLVLSSPTRRSRAFASLEVARTLAKQAMDAAVYGPERAYFKVNNDCEFNDDHRIFLNVPPHEHEYARSKGAWWDHDTQRYFLYHHAERPSSRDVGAYYDMCPTDYVNLREMFGNTPPPVNYSKGGTEKHLAP